jgi:hypothetical protein
VDDEEEDDGGEDGEEGEADLDPKAKGGELAFQAFDTFVLLRDEEAGGGDLLGDAGDLGALVLQLAVEAGVGKTPKQLTA